MEEGLDREGSGIGAKRHGASQSWRELSLQTALYQGFMVNERDRDSFP